VGEGGNWGIAEEYVRIQGKPEVDPKNWIGS